MREAVQRANDSAYGLQCGIFTKDWETAMKAWDALEVGGVVLNEIPSSRIDALPYGGVKDSGLGREGIRSAMDEMTEPRMLLVKRSGDDWL